MRAFLSCATQLSRLNYIQYLTKSKFGTGLHAEENSATSTVQLPSIASNEDLREFLPVKLLRQLKMNVCSFPLDYWNCRKNINIFNITITYFMHPCICKHLFLCAEIQTREGAGKGCVWRGISCVEARWHKGHVTWVVVDSKRKVLFCGCERRLLVHLHQGVILFGRRDYLIKRPLMDSSIHEIM